jgi:hypothetical protein
MFWLKMEKKKNTHTLDEEEPTQHTAFLSIVVSLFPP